MSKEKLKVRWAIDLNEENKEGWQGLRRVLKGLKETYDVDLIPTYLFRDPKNSWYHLPTVIVDQPEASMKEKIHKFVEQMDVGDFKEPEVVAAEGFSLRQDLQHFANFVNENSCDLLILNSHSKGAVKRFFLGSFAENLMMHAKVPLLIVPPGVECIDLGKVLFSTDFSISGRMAFEDFLSRHHDLLKEVTVYSKSIYPVSSLAVDPYFTIDHTQTVTQIWDDIYKKKIQRGQEWKQEFAKYDVKITPVVEDSTEDLITCVNSYVDDNKLGMVVMPSFIDRKMALFTGSFTRELVRSASVPVYIRHYFSK